MNITQQQYYTDEFYTQNSKHFNSYLNKLSVDNTIPINNIKTERYDILQADLLRDFKIKISAKYFAFLIELENGKITRAFCASSGSDLVEFAKNASIKKSNISAEEFYTIVKEKSIPPYIRR
jgi:hypothetical protein